MTFSIRYWGEGRLARKGGGDSLPHRSEERARGGVGGERRARGGQRRARWARGAARGADARSGEWRKKAHLRTNVSRETFLDAKATEEPRRRAQGAQESEDPRIRMAPTSTEGLARNAKAGKQTRPQSRDKADSRRIRRPSNPQTNVSRETSSERPRGKRACRRTCKAQTTKQQRRGRGQERNSRQRERKHPKGEARRGGGRGREPLTQEGAENPRLPV